MNFLGRVLVFSECELEHGIDPAMEREKHQERNREASIGEDAFLVAMDGVMWVLIAECLISHIVEQTSCCGAKERDSQAIVWHEGIVNIAS